MQSKPHSHHVRFAPKATVRHPKRDLSLCAKSEHRELFDHLIGAQEN
jgi:hypothetical protein